MVALKDFHQALHDQFSLTILPHQPHQTQHRNQAGKNNKDSHNKECLASRPADIRAVSRHSPADLLEVFRPTFLEQHKERLAVSKAFPEGLEEEPRLSLEDSRQLPVVNLDSLEFRRLEDPDPSLPFLEHRKVSLGELTEEFLLRNRASLADHPDTEPSQAIPEGRNLADFQMYNPDILEDRLERRPDSPAFLEHRKANSLEHHSSLDSPVLNNLEDFLERLLVCPELHLATPERRHIPERHRSSGLIQI